MVAAGAVPLLRAVARGSERRVWRRTGSLSKQSETNSANPSEKSDSGTSGASPSMMLDSS